MRLLRPVVFALLTPFAIAQDTSRTSRHDARALAVAIDTFGSDLLGRLPAKEGGACVSPASVAVTLLMAMHGAREETWRELANLLHVGDWTQAEVAAATAQLIARLREPGERIEVAIADDIWLQAGHPVRADYLAAVAKVFGAEVAAVDFDHDVAGACKLVNARIAAATKGRIPDLLSPGLLVPAPRLVLTNAVYFHANWSSPFAEAATQDGPFVLADGTEVKVPCMHQVHEHSLAETEDMQVLWLPYVDSRFGLVMALPRGNGTIEQAVTALSLRTSRTGVQAGWQIRQVTLTLPRFRCEAAMDLGATLQALGLRMAMDPLRADFRGIDDGAGQLCLGRVIHRVYFDVAEKGTEAAAATATTLMVGAAIRRDVPTPAVFCADHAFAYALVDNASGLCWFVGRVTDPRPRGK